MFTIKPKPSDLNYLVKKLPIHTLRGRIFDLLNVGRNECKKKTIKNLKALARGLEINDNAILREFWENLYIYFSDIAVSKKDYNYFNPCRDEPPEIKRKLSPAKLKIHRRYYKSYKGRKNILKSVKAYDQRNKKNRQIK